MVTWPRLPNSKQGKMVWEHKGSLKYPKIWKKQKNPPALLRRAELGRMDCPLRGAALADTKHLLIVTLTLSIAQQQRLRAACWALCTEGESRRGPRQSLASMTMVTWRRQQLILWVTYFWWPQKGVQGTLTCSLLCLNTIYLRQGAKCLFLFECQNWIQRNFWVLPVNDI